MPPITDLLDDAVAGEPAISLRAADVVALGRRRARRRRAAGLASAACVTAAGVAIAMSVLGSADRPASRVAAAGGSRSTASSQVASHQTSASPAEVTGRDTITPASLPRLVERELHADLTYARSEQLGGDIDLGAGIARIAGHPARKQYLNVQVMSRHNLITDPTCARLSGNGTNGDGYTGPCRIRHLSHGDLLVLRDGRSAHGGYRITAATLFRPDGSGIAAEATNQAVPNKPLPHRGEPVVSTDPPVSAGRLGDLVLALANARVSS